MTDHMGWTEAMFSPCRKAFFTSSWNRDHFFDAAIASKALIFTTGLKVSFIAPGSPMPYPYLYFRELDRKRG